MVGEGRRLHGLVHLGLDPALAVFHLVEMQAL